MNANHPQPRPVSGNTARAVTPPRRPPLPVSRDPFRRNPILVPDRDDDPRARRRLWIASAVLHAVVLVGVVLVSVFAPEPTPEPEPIDVVFWRERPEPPPALDLAAPEPEPVREPEPIAEAIPEPPRETVPPEPVPEPVRREPPPPAVARTPPPTPRPQPVAPEPAPAPERVARTGAFGGTPPERTASDDRAPRAVQTAGFAAGDLRNDVPVAERRRVVARGTFGSDTVPAVPREEPRRRAPATGGFGSVEADPAPAPSPRRAATISTGGFGDGDAPAAAGATPARAGSVRTGGFGSDDAAPAAAAKTRSLPKRSLDRPVDVVSKPRPVYTDEARELRIEGEVVLEVTFRANGTLDVHRVLDGLGHGLDEAAIAAARDIEFEPARRDGRPVDHTATLRVVFRLA